MSGTPAGANKHTHGHEQAARGATATAAGCKVLYQRDEHPRADRSQASEALSTPDEGAQVSSEG